MLRAFVASAVTGFAEHGFGYNLTNINFTDILNKRLREAIEQWETLPLSAPGLFSLPVRTATNFHNIPGGG